MHEDGCIEGTDSARDDVARMDGGRAYDEEDVSEDDYDEYCNHGLPLGHCQRAGCIAAFEELMEDMYMQ